MKIKNAKALSPVVASIILIAVTVAVSIAVGVWMFGLTGSFMGGAEQLKITGVVFGGATNDHFNLTMQNPGTSSVTVTDVWVGNTKITSWSAANPNGLTVYSNSQNTTQVTFTWSAGYGYEVKVITSKGNTVSYPCTAPYT